LINTLRPPYGSQELLYGILQSLPGNISNFTGKIANGKEREGGKITTTGNNNPSIKYFAGINMSREI
jgi:hypothetical protein